MQKEFLSEPSLSHWNRTLRQSAAIHSSSLWGGRAPVRETLTLNTGHSKNLHKEDSAVLKSFEALKLLSTLVFLFFFFFF